MNDFFEKHVKDVLYIGVILAFVLLYILKPTGTSKETLLKQENELLQAKVKFDFDSISSLNKDLKISDSIKADLQAKYQSNKPIYEQIIKNHYYKDSIANTLSVIELQREITNYYKSSN